MVFRDAAIKETSLIRVCINFCYFMHDFIPDCLIFHPLVNFTKELPITELKIDSWCSVHDTRHFGDVRMKCGKRAHSGAMSLQNKC